MWYFIKMASSCEKFGPVTTLFWTQYIIFFLNLGNGRENKNRRR